MSWDQGAHARGSSSLEKIRLERLNNEIKQWLSSGDDPNRRRYTEYGRALDAISRAALEYNAEAEEDSFERLLDRGIAVVSQLRWAVQGDTQNQDEVQQLKLWSHREQPLWEVKKGQIPDFNRAEVEAIVGDYLALPYRSQYLDRILIDVLIALELYSFADEMLNEPSLPGIPARSPLVRSHPVVRFLRFRSVEAVVLLAPAGLLVLLAQNRYLSEVWANKASSVLVGIFVLSAAWGAIVLPFDWRSHKKSTRLTRSLMNEMISCYSELKTNGPVSARRLVERLGTAADKGVAWPAPLYALLDDILGRTGRI
jgi:hypothetical protein